MNQEMIDKIKSYALSNEDINIILEPDTKIISYPDFATMNSIDDAFDRMGRCVFLFLTTSETSGHWLCMFKKDNTISYFDSYGEKPEAQRCWLSQEQLDELGEGEPYLMNLLRKSGFKVFYNTVQYQKERQDVNSCGRWCVMRLICKDMDDKQFYNTVMGLMKQYDVKTCDDVATIFTFEHLGK